jgi:hypothetical protein
MSVSRPPLPDRGGPPLTPSAFLEAGAARLDRLHGADPGAPPRHPRQERDG